MINFRKKSWKVRRALQKQNRGEKPRKQSTQFQGVKIFAHLISRCENFAHPKTKVRNPWAKGSNFRTPQFQGAKPIPRCEIHFQGANFLKSNFAHHCGRCENFRTVRNGVRKFRTLLFKMRKFRTPHFKVRILLSKGGHFRTPKSKVRNFQSKVRKFRTVKFSALKILNWLLN